MLFVATLCACSPEPDTDLVITCEPITDPVLLTQGMPGRVAVGASVGILDEQVMLHWVDSSPRAPPDIDRVQWFDQTLEPTVAPSDLGTRRGLMRSQWTASGGALRAYVWTDPSFASNPAELETLTILVGVSPPDPSGSYRVETTEIMLPVARRAEGLGTLSLGSILFAGLDGRIPARVWRGEATYAVAAVPQGCDEMGAVGRIVLANARGGDILTWPGLELCPDPRLLYLPELVALDGELLGVFFREGSAFDAHLQYVRVGAGLVATGQPVVVSRQEVGYFSRDDGYQPEAVAVGGSRILFRERAGQGTVRSSNHCQWLSVMAQDGSGSHSAPWQMPACREPLAHFTHSSELVGAPGGRAAFAFGQRTSFGALSELTQITLDTDWEEGVFLVALTADGRRGSEVMRVSGPEATALFSERTSVERSSPFARDFDVAAASEGDLVVVAWRDERPDAPGIWGRSYRCRDIADE